MIDQPSDGPERLWSRIEKLSAAAIRISAVHEVDAVLQEITDAAREVIGATYAALGVLGEGGKGVDRFVTSGVTPELKEKIGSPPSVRLSLGKILMWTLLHGQTPR